MTDNLHQIKLIEHIYKIIRSECDDNLYSPFQDCQQSCQRIINATTILLNDAACITRNKLPSAPKTNLSLDEIEQLFRSMLEIILIPDNITSKELKIKKLLVKNNLQPNILLFNDTWSGNFFDWL